ncbi:LPS translocon maturation chaperone LptM [Halothiobacillus sp.]|uniref:LPS translocon maturation chaperone LptM n=1 Tax=Halothiobacillus sp. TaxID=1891311 RepID=UPI003A0FD893
MTSRRSPAGYLTPTGLILFGLLVSGCGQKGPLVLSDQNADQHQAAIQPATPPPTNTQP